MNIAANTNTTSTTGISVIFTWEPPPEPPAAPVREPRRPLPPGPPVLAAVRAPDGTWEVP